jgi:hypothetical protein
MPYFIDHGNSPTTLRLWSFLAHVTLLQGSHMRVCQVKTIAFNHKQEDYKANQPLGTTLSGHLFYCISVIVWLFVLCLAQQTVR